MFSQLLQGKTFVWIFISTIFLPFFSYLETYVFCDWEFLKFLMILMAIDTITGFVKYFKLKRVSSHAFAKIFTKIILYFSVLVITHVVTNFKVAGSVNVLFGWFDDFAYSALIVREAISILENLGYICPGMIPKSLLKKLKEFDSSGNFKNN